MGNITNIAKQPAYLETVLIRCIECRRVMKSNGETCCQHTELLHKHSPGEKAVICRTCRNNARVWQNLVGQSSSWTAGKVISPENL